MAIAPAPLGRPKTSTSAFAYVTDCIGERKIERLCIAPPAPGMKTNCTVADSVPALKSESSVRHCEPPTPSVCAETETSDRYGTRADPTLITCVAVLDDALFAT